MFDAASHLRAVSSQEVKLNLGSPLFPKRDPIVVRIPEVGERIVEDDAGIIEVALVRLAGAHAEACGSRLVQSFAATLRTDSAAVQAALVTRWSNGPVEGLVISSEAEDVFSFEKEDTRAG